MSTAELADAVSTAVDNADPVSGRRGSEAFNVRLVFARSAASPLVARRTRPHTSGFVLVEGIAEDGIVVVAELDSGNEILAAGLRTMSDVAILDIELPVLDGLSVDPNS
ncbi:hypothetical protein [Nocardia sp. NPDC051463]|uniref:hypothetical protein n=1 Tax=Nocardia sp. NPDC051463 TaxID=3154845 RepID=UPI00344EBB5A